MTVEVLAGLRRSNAMQWEPTAHRPAEWLMPYVLGYVADEAPTGPDMRVHCIPNGIIVVTFDLDSPPRRSLGSADARIDPSPVVGMHTGVHMLTTAGRRHSLSVLLTPWGAHTLFGLGMHELTNHYVNVADLIGPEAQELTERLAEERSWATRFTMVDEALSRWFAVRPEPSATVVWAWRRLEECGGRISIDELAKEVGWSGRLLQVRFREQIGLSPKKVARIMRFHRTAKALVSGERSLSEIAFEYGYWDQAHLNLEFRNLCGHTPIGFLNATSAPYPQAG